VGEWRWGAILTNNGLPNKHAENFKMKKKSGIQAAKDYLAEQGITVYRLPNGSYNIAFVPYNLSQNGIKYWAENIFITRLADQIGLKCQTNHSSITIHFSDECRYAHYALRLLNQPIDKSLSILKNHYAFYNDLVKVGIFPDYIVANDDSAYCLQSIYWAKEKGYNKVETSTLRHFCFHNLPEDKRYQTILEHNHKSYVELDGLVGLERLSKLAAFL
jgi:hypothetical protein